MEDLKEGKPGQWYSLLKRLCSSDQMKSNQTECEEIRDKPDQEQAELIADQFSSVSNEYSPIDSSKISSPPILEGSVPSFTPLQVLHQILKLKSKKSTAPGIFLPYLLKNIVSSYVFPLAIS